MSLVAVSVIGVDRPGIIAAVTGALAQVGGNLEDSSMTILGGHFAMSLIVSVEGDEHAVRAALEPVTASLGLSSFVGSGGEEPDHTSVGLPYIVSVHGADRPGIVSRVMGVIASYGGNVSDLTTRLSGDLYVSSPTSRCPCRSTSSRCGPPSRPRPTSWGSRSRYGRPSRT